MCVCLQPPVAAARFNVPLCRRASTCCKFCLLFWSLLLAIASLASHLSLCLILSPTPPSGVVALFIAVLLQFVFVRKLHFSAFYISINFSSCAAAFLLCWYFGMTLFILKTSRYFFALSLCFALPLHVFFISFLPFGLWEIYLAASLSSPVYGVVVKLGTPENVMMILDKLQCRRFIVCRSSK